VNVRSYPEDAYESEALTISLAAPGVLATTLSLVAKDRSTVPAETLVDRTVLSALDAELSGTGGERSRRAALAAATVCRRRPAFTTRSTTYVAREGLRAERRARRNISSPTARRMSARCTAIAAGGSRAARSTRSRRGRAHHARTTTSGSRVADNSESAT